VKGTKVKETYLESSSGLDSRQVLPNSIEDTSVTKIVLDKFLDSQHKNPRPSQE
jgi:hypothetical protein